ncbi:hypothetical protein [Allokutzneria oryzae]|uniref:Transposase n=1 Tax=Allokutzneria oryzae TaxID=1378989 RepID=A0ABV5ZTP6_9PSEU
MQRSFGLRSLQLRLSLVDRVDQRCRVYSRPDRILKPMAWVLVHRTFTAVARIHTD